MNITETVKVQYLGGVVVMNGDTVEAVIAFTGAQLRDLYFGKTVKSTLHLKIEDNAGDS